MEQWRAFLRERLERQDIVDTIHAMFPSDNRVDKNFRKRALALAPEILEASIRSELPPALLIAVLKKESGIDMPPIDASPRSMERGPMQLTTTARKEINRLSAHPRASKWHYDYTSVPELHHAGGETLRDNIVAGAMYLRKLLNNENGDLKKALNKYRGSSVANAAGYADLVLTDYYKSGL